MFRTPWSKVLRQPPIVRRWTLTYVGFAVACGVLALTFTAVREPLGLPRRGWPLIAPIALGLLPGFVVWPYLLWRTRWLRRAWRDSGGRLCVTCAYDLTAAPDQGTCPECGGRVDVLRDRERWLIAGLAPPSAPTSPSNGDERR